MAYSFSPATFSPNGSISPSAIRVLVFGQVAVFVFFWALATPPVIPKPWDALRSLASLWRGGIVANVMTSAGLYAESVACAAGLSLLLCYATAVPFFRPLAAGFGKLRFLGLVGLPFLFTLYIHNIHALKVALLSFSISVFLVTSMLDVLASIPREKFDLARTLRMGEWQVVWEVMVLGRLDVALDSLRQNAAIGWMMVPAIEGLFKMEGGLGAALDVSNHHFALADIAAMQIIVLGIGLTQDYMFGVVKSAAFPYADMLTQRR